MISRAVTLFLVVTTTVSGRIIQRPKSHPHEMLLMPSSSWGLQPIPIAEPCEPEIPKRIPVPIVMPTLPEPCLDEVFVPEIPMALPQPPALPAFVMPELPRVEAHLPEPCLEDNLIPVAPNPEYIPSTIPFLPIEPVFAPEMPVMKIPTAPALPPLEMPALPEISVQAEPCFDEVISEIPVAVPQPPELPAFVMPELPVRVEVPIAEPCLDEQPIPVAPIPEYIPSAPMPLPVVPQAPELPAFVMPELPVRVEVPIAEPCLDEYPIPVVPIPEYIPPAPMPLPVVPQAPELPTFIMPELPVRIEVPMAEPCLDEQPIQFAPISEYIPQAPMPLPVVPQAPELPTFVMPELPVRIETPIAEPCLEDQPILPVPMPEYIPLPAPMPMPAAEPCEPAFVPEMPVFIPTAPALPARTEPIIAPCPEDLPAVSIPQYIRPLALPAAPELPVRVEMAKPEEPCVIGEIALVVPQQPKFPNPIAMPIMPAYPQTADPCEPSAMKMAELPPYFVRQPSREPKLNMPIGFYNHLPTMGSLQHVRHF